MFEEYQIRHKVAVVLKGGRKGPQVHMSIT